MTFRGEGAHEQRWTAITGSDPICIEETGQSVDGQHGGQLGSSGRPARYQPGKTSQPTFPFLLIGGGSFDSEVTHRAGGALTHGRLSIRWHQGLIVPVGAAWEA